MDVERYRSAERTWWAHLGVSPTEHDVELPRVGVRVRVQEVGSGPPTLFVHGASVAGSSYADLAVRMPDRRCLLLDRPGCGLSDPVEPPPGLEGLPALADQLVVDVLDGLGIERADLVSTSMGGFFALRAAAARPDRIGRIVHHGWCLGSPVADLPLVMRLAGLPGLGQLMARVPATPGSVRSMLRMVGLREAIDRGRVPEAAIAWNVALQNHTATRRHEYALARGAPLPEMMSALLLPSDLLERVSSPVRVLWGTEDPFGTTETMQALVDELPEAEMVVMEGAGHAVWLDDLDAATRLTHEFLTAGTSAHARAR